MTKKRMFIFASLGVMTVVCLAFGIICVGRDPINASTCAKIEEGIDEGMTDADVTRIIGRPCDDHRQYAVPTTEFSDGATRKVIRNTTIKIWRGPSGSIRVTFEEEAWRVQDVQFSEIDDSVWRKIRRTIGLEEPLWAIPEARYDESAYPKQAFAPNENPPR